MMHTRFVKLQNMVTGTALSAFTGMLIASAIPASAAPPSTVTFSLFPNPAVVNCLARFPGDSSRPPFANVTVTRGTQNDTLTLTLGNIKPGLNFDLFTVERSFFLTGGAKDPHFTNFGLGWYQSDVHANEDGAGVVTVKTILLDQIFGLDQDVPALNATTKATTHHTFHVGFWFNNPQNAVPCGFDATKPTPFNGEQKAGPLAMMSRPRPTGLGPLCSNPNTATHPASCNP
ncbi:MAG: hypothetical protein JNM48_07550 [Rhodospirillales bacterium]|nr:hypothetical protein [Rhodospirillales bacterium]